MHLLCKHLVAIVIENGVMTLSILSKLAHGHSLYPAGPIVLQLRTFPRLLSGGKCDSSLRTELRQLGCFSSHLLSHRKQQSPETHRAKEFLSSQGHLLWLATCQRRGNEAKPYLPTVLGFLCLLQTQWDFIQT